MGDEHAWGDYGLGIVWSTFERYILWFVHISHYVRILPIYLKTEGVIRLRRRYFWNSQGNPRKWDGTTNTFRTLALLERPGAAKEEIRVQFPLLQDGVSSKGELVSMGEQTIGHSEHLHCSWDQGNTQYLAKTPTKRNAYCTPALSWPTPDLQD